MKASWLFTIFEADHPFVTLYGLETITRKSQARLLKIKRYTLSPIWELAPSIGVMKKEKRIEMFRKTKSPNKNKSLATIDIQRLIKSTTRLVKIYFPVNESEGLEEA